MPDSIVFISAQPPCPPTGGGTRIYHILKSLIRSGISYLFILFPCDIDELPLEIKNGVPAINTGNFKLGQMPQVRSATFFRFLRMILIPRSISRKELILSADYFITHSYEGKKIFMKLFHRLLRYILFFHCKKIYKQGFPFAARSLERFDEFQEQKNAIQNAIKNAKVLWIEFSSLLPYFKVIRSHNSSLKIVCDAHNIEYKLLERLESLSKNNLERKWYKSQAAIMKKEELNGFKYCDLIITCSESDRNEILLNLPGANVQVIPNGVDTDYFVPHSQLTPEPSLLFTGTMGYAPNKDAVEYFLEKIFPYVIQMHPSCRFIIAGANAAEVFKRYTGADNIEIVSSPADMRPVYDKAWIVVVPLRSGSGTRLKILEAMAMEKPVVSTSVGTEGIDVTDNVHLFIADEEKEFAEKINLLIEHKEIAKRLSTAAKERICELYNWKCIEQMARNEILQLA